MLRNTDMHETKFALQPKAEEKHLITGVTFGAIKINNILNWHRPCHLLLFQSTQASSHCEVSLGYFSSNTTEHHFLQEGGGRTESLI